MRTVADFYQFLKSDETPPADVEQWILWKFDHYLLTEKEAVLELAEHRRATRDVWAVKRNRNAE